MKRDMELVREILLATEAGQTSLGYIELEIPGRSQEELSYHVEIMADAGLIEAEDLCHLGPDGYIWQPKHLTWTGHEFLDSVRDPEIWRKTMEGANKAGGFGLDLLGALAKGFIRQQVKQRTGIDIDL